MQDLADKVAVVTGAASGIGRALAERFATEGMRVVLADVEQAALDATVAELRSRHLAVSGVVTDVSKAHSVEALASRTVEMHGKVHVLCNNAGVLEGHPGPVWESTLNDWQWILGVNLWGVIHGIRAFLPAMLAHGEAGHVVNTASTVGLVSGEGLYSTSKHAVLALSEGVYAGLKQRQANIGCSVLCPTFVSTQVRSAERNRPPDLLNAAAESMPGRGPSPYGRFERPPAFIAEAVVTAIRGDQFYIIPSGELDPFIQERMANVLSRTNPNPSTWSSRLLPTVQADERP
jgi:NAD(P)-dependent dehydrogenase (short-subunit alcohol dehydrogenase family)